MCLLGQDRHSDPEQIDAGRSVLRRWHSASEIILAAALASRAEDQDTIDLAVLSGLKDESIPDGYEIVHLSAVRPGAQTYGGDGQEGRRADVQGYEGRTASHPGARRRCGAGNPSVDKAVNQFAARGFRSLGVARAGEQGSWKFLGVLPLYDPPREDSKVTIADRRHRWV